MPVPQSVETRDLPLDAERRDAVERAAAALNGRWMQDLLVRLVETPSPFGEERTIAELLAGEMAGIGLEAEVQALDARSANAIGRRRGARDGPELLLFAPLDSPFTGRAEDEVPWVGDSLPDHMVARAVVGDGTVTGLSADNPKAHIVSIISAIRAVLEAGIELSGDILAAFGAGGAPANPRPGDDRPDVGHGRGCRHMLEHGLDADFAVVAKPGYAVAWEEVGLCWFRIRVRGVQTYVGRKHVLAYRNPIAEAAKVIAGLEAWFDDYARRHTDGLVAPQGAVGAIQGGWTYKPSMVPAACDLYVDMRIGPRTAPDEARRELQAALAGIAARHDGLEAECETILAIPGAGTDPQSWIIQSAIRGFEDTEAAPHAPFLETSGQTEAVILRAAGIPTARFGLPAAMTAAAGRPRHSMGQVEIAGMLRYARCLIYTIIDTCTRSRAEVGL
ncbi:MAG: peptidase dimerization domain-containing protein [Defluviicoccus sp.]|nr:peptidase dimerization domain-containing protein [Defluviicoccus sp.]MDE0385716.1 peptidase dimerization domain-containing protein [Defluviicoccus sp.]